MVESFGGANFPISSSGIAVMTTMRNISMKWHGEVSNRYFPQVFIEFYANLGIFLFDPNLPRGKI